MRILIATDSFPPGCGGSGWSTYELARGLRRRGHLLTIVQPRPGRLGGEREFDGFTVREIGAAAPNLPFIRNYCKNERLYARLTPRLAQIAAETDCDVIHAQHVLTCPPAVAAARRTGRPAVCTVRDYWPVCYWSDLIHDPSADRLCEACSAAAMRRCIRPRGGAMWPLALPLVPYMRANLARKQRSLASADRVIAVSTAIRADLEARAAGLSVERLVTIPNPVDIGTIRETAAAQPKPLEGPYVLYVGKLAPNKGTPRLIAAVDRAATAWPLVIVGDGPDRPLVEAWARRHPRTTILTGWLPREQVLGWMAHAALLVFPSHGPESLSRVLLEAGALGVPIAAMDTGGTRDIVLHGRTGLLSSSAESLGDDVAALVEDRGLASRLGAAARAHVEEHFAADSVVARIEQVYAELR